MDLSKQVLLFLNSQRVKKNASENENAGHIQIWLWSFSPLASIAALTLLILWEYGP